MTAQGVPGGVFAQLSGIVTLNTRRTGRLVRRATVIAFLAALNCWYSWASLLRFYTHLMPSSEKRARAAIDDLLDGDRSGRPT
jgi:hypothetical protein